MTEKEIIKHLEDISTADLIQEYQRRVKNRVPMLVAQINGAIRELNSLDIPVVAEFSLLETVYRCTSVEYDEHSKEVKLDID